MSRDGLTVLTQAHDTACGECPRGLRCDEDYGKGFDDWWFCDAWRKALTRAEHHLSQEKEVI